MESTLVESVNIPLNFPFAQIYVKINGQEEIFKLNLGGREIEKVSELFELLNLQCGLVYGP